MRIASSHAIACVASSVGAWRRSVRRYADAFASGSAVAASASPAGSSSGGFSACFFLPPLPFSPPSFAFAASASAFAVASDSAFAFASAFRRLLSAFLRSAALIPSSPPSAAASAAASFGLSASFRYVSIAPHAAAT